MAIVAAEIFLRFRLNKDDDFIPAPPFQIFQSSDTVTQQLGIVLPAQTDIDVTAKSPTAGSKITASFFLIFTDV